MMQPHDTGGVNNFPDKLTQYSQGGTSKISSVKGDPDGYDAGNKAGALSGISIVRKVRLWTVQQWLKEVSLLRWHLLLLQTHPV